MNLLWIFTVYRVYTKGGENLNGAISKEEAEKLFETYKDYIYRGALFLTKSKEIADDITQETFIKAFNYYHTYDESKPIKPWLYKIMLNVTHTLMKEQRQELNLEAIVHTSEEDNVEYCILQEEMNKELWQDINRLGVKIREVLYMHYYLEMKLDDIAKLLDIPLGTCKSRLNTGLSRLRKNKSTSILSYRRERQVE